MTDSATFEIFLQLMRVFHILVEDLEPGLKELKLEPKEFFLLSAVEENPNPAQLARALLLPSPTVSFLIKRVEKNGYIKRENDKNDLRRFRLTLTARGRTALTRGTDLLDGALKKRFGCLDATERDAFVAALNKIAELPS